MGVDLISVIHDVEKIFADVWPLPSLGDFAAVKATLTKVIPDLVQFAHDIGLDQLQAAFDNASKLRAAGNGPVGKIGDGHILQWVITNAPAIMAFVTQIIAIFPKAEKPAE